MSPRRFRKLLDLNSIPDSWRLVRLSVDWSGGALLLFVDGKAEFPEITLDMEAFTQCYRTLPKAHHLIYWSGDVQKTLCFDQFQGLSTFHVQPLQNGWLLGDRRGGRAVLYDDKGCVRRSIDLGDASEDIQTTSDERIWVSYFDEGVFGRGIGMEGVVCFDGFGAPMFRFGEFAVKRELPMIADCYAMNVASSRDVWINYYMDFPLIHLRDHDLERVRPEFGVLGNQFAIKDDTVLYLRNSQLEFRNLERNQEPEPIGAIDEQGLELIPIASPHLGFVARGWDVILNTEAAIYKMIP